MADATNHRLGDRHHVRFGFLVNIDLHAFFAIGSRHNLSLFMRPRHLRHILDLHVSVRRAFDDGLGNLGQVREFVQRAHHILGVAFVHRASGDVDVLLAKPVNHRLDGNARAAKRLFVHANVNLLFQSASHPNGGHSRYRLQFPFELQLGNAAKPTKAGLALVSLAAPGKTQFHHRIQSRIKVQQKRPFRLVRKKHQVELFQRILTCLGHVRAP